MTHLVNNTYFQLLLIKKKGKHGTHNVKINVGKFNAWYMKKYENNNMGLLMAK